MKSLLIYTGSYAAAYLCSFLFAIIYVIAKPQSELSNEFFFYFLGAAIGASVGAYATSYLLFKQRRQKYLFTLLGAAGGGLFGVILIFLTDTVVPGLDLKPWDLMGRVPDLTTIFASVGATLTAEKSNLKP